MIMIAKVFINLIKNFLYLHNNFISKIVIIFYQYFQLSIYIHVIVYLVNQLKLFKVQSNDLLKEILKRSLILLIMLLSCR